MTLSINVVSAGTGKAFSDVFIGVNTLMMGNEMINDTSMMGTDSHRRQISPITSSSMTIINNGMNDNVMNGANKNDLGSNKPE
jgi:hypothetical protein